MSQGGWRFGAGRPRSRGIVEAHRRLDVGRLAALGALESGEKKFLWLDGAGRFSAAIVETSCDGGFVDLTYTAGGRPVRLRSAISWTRCNFGGRRPWLSCPGCESRIATLYLRAERFWCRRCHNLAYRSQAHDPIQRLWRQQRELEARLGPGLGRPKGMWVKTHLDILEAITRCTLRRAELIDSAIHALAVSLGQQVARSTQNSRHRPGTFALAHPVDTRTLAKR